MRPAPRKAGVELAAPIRCPQCQPHDLQADVGAAAFVRDRKAVTRETDFAAADQADADRAGAGHHDGAVRPAMSAETGSQAVADEETEANGCIILLRVASAPARPRPARPIPRASAQNLALKTGLLGCNLGGSMMDRHAFSMPIRVVAGPELPRRAAGRIILDPSAATGTAAVNAEIRGTFRSP